MSDKQLKVKPLLQNNNKPIKLKENTNHLYTWGFSKYAQTGIDNCQYSIEPTYLNFPLAQEITTISAGENNTAFITKDNFTYIFGKNAFGELGDDSKRQSYIPKLLSIKCEMISLGGEHVIALTKENTLYSWGLNIFGQLGLGHTENVSTPTIVDRFGVLAEQENGIFLKEIPRNISNEQIIEISAGAQHSMILTSKNTLYSCGFAKNGSLGYFNSGNELEPTESMIFTKITTKPTSKKYSKISCGVNHSGCLLGSTDILIWGKSEFFDFDGIKRFNLYNTINSPGTDAMSVSETLNTDNSNNSTSFILTDLQIGENFIVLLSSNGELFSSGSNEFGQLGIGQTPRSRLFEKVRLTEKIKKISVGFNFVFALGFDGKVYAWGNNRYGQILDIERDVCPVPKEIPQLVNLNPISFACGGYHVVSLCNNEINKEELNTKEKIFNFKKIPLNRSFDPFLYKKESDVLKNVTELLQQQLSIEDEIKAKEKKIIEMSKKIEEKAKLKLEQAKKKKESKITLKSNINLEKVLEEEIKLEDLTFPEHAFLGCGAFGEVKKAYWRKCLVAVKFLKKALENQEDQVIPFIEEFNLLKNLRHPNILLYIGGCISGPEYFIVTEYCENGNLFELLHGARPIVLNVKEKLHLALEIAKGVNYLHSFNPPILHRDLKSLNILLNKNFQIKIADFGWARLRNIHMTRLRGTFQWMAPEVILKDNYTEKADVYSFGIILWEFWSVEPPYKDIVAKDVANNVKKDRTYRPKIPSDMPKEISELMQRCWDYDPAKRPTYLEIINYIEAYMDTI